MPGLEAPIERWVCERALKLYGVESSKLGQGGDPDQIFWIPVTPLLIEFKAPGEKPDDHQVLRHAQLLHRGYDVQVHTNREEALAAIKAALDAAPVPKKSRQVLARSLFSGVVSRSRARQDKHQRRSK